MSNLSHQYSQELKSVLKSAIDPKVSGEFYSDMSLKCECCQESDANCVLST